MGTGAVVLVLPCAGGKTEVWGGRLDVYGAGRLGSIARSPSFVVLPAKSVNRNGNCERGCEGKLIRKRSSLSG